MITEASVAFIGRATILDQLSDAFQPVVGQMCRRAGARGQRLKHFLNGTSMGYPLHPALTDVPIGSWTTALVLDVLGMVTGRDDPAGLGAWGWRTLSSTAAQHCSSQDHSRCDGGPAAWGSFSADAGHVVDGPSAFAQPCFETRVRDGRIEVRGVSR